MKFTKKSFQVESLGDCRIKSPLHLSTKHGDDLVNYEDDSRRVLLENVVKQGNKDKKIDFGHSFEIAGPRKKLFFNPAAISCAIITCGGLCPGINNVIRSLVMHLHYGYGVKRILGLKYGYQGLIPEYWHAPIELTPEFVADINEKGGTILGTSRGDQDIKKMVDTLQSLNIDVLFTIGGDGTLKGAHEIYHEIKKRKAKIAVVGLPKTIDNDLMYIDKTFGFETAFSEAAKSISSAHTEAECAPNGVGLVKLMGRHSGYVSAYAALSLREVNLVLIPEQKFKLEKVYDFIKMRLEKRGHVVVVVAEGAGQENFRTKDVLHDSSGNVKLYDIGRFLVKAIKDHFAEIKMEIDLKYIDPSYMIRSAPANSTDSVFTGTLGEYAADAAMAGKTGIAVGYWKGLFTHIPLEMVISQRNVISLESELWRNVLKATGQPPTMS